MSKLTLQKTKKQVRYFTEPLTPEVGLDMIWVPGDSFDMGSPTDEPKRRNNEGPQHLVTVPAFFMGRYPVTQAQWRFVAGLRQEQQTLQPAPSNFKGDMRPVEKVNWDDAMEFCVRLSRHTGREYRLPSEAEWEYACRAGTTTPFYFGKTLTSDLANYRGTVTYNNGPKGEYRKETTPVDQFEYANAFGLSDMHGNVLEWCLDHWHKSYEGAPEDGSAWLTDNENASRVLRGGSWSNDPRHCRSAYRDNTTRDDRFNFIGFRVVSVAPRTLG
ncbi:MAG: formylglycine-generating enzyme family protein [Cyanobacteria bacterium J06559_3]